MLPLLILQSIVVVACLQAVTQTPVEQSTKAASSPVCVAVTQTPVELSTKAVCRRLSAGCDLDSGGAEH
jgi:hypothetical protein